ncbi:MAG: hypothetical protein EOP86_11745 [Verrucomicrobiaceae bacterium]|nr:MAG: hypothetical protein EOP86_11745 [Verrucomicrobiaceae bacterium]
MDKETDTSSVPPFKDALTYPVRGSGKYILAIGSMIVALLSFSSLLAVLSGIALLCFTAYLTAYYVNIVEVTILGRDEAPDWPDITDPLDEIILPFLRALGVYVFSFLPNMAVALVFHGERSLWINPLFLITLAAGAVYFPVAMLNVIVSNDILKAGPRRVLPRIIGALPFSLMMGGVYLGTVMIPALLKITMGGVPFLGSLLGAASSIYLMMALSRLAGLFHLNHPDADLDTEPEENGNEAE